MALLALTVQAKNNPIINSCRHQHCLALIDAGSTGSRLHLYRFDKDSNHQLSKIQDIYSKSIQPGLSSLELSPEAVDRYFSELLKDAPKMPIPSVLYATAGMRLRPELEQQQMYALIQGWFSEHSQWSLRQARTISGKEEGTFAWLALNHYLNQQESNRSMPALIEIGGASAQIAFPIKDPKTILPDDCQKLSLNQQTVYLYVHSFLGLGAKELSQHFDQEAVCFAKGLPMRQKQLGEGDAHLCRAQVSNFLDTHYPEVHLTQDIFAQSQGQDWYTVASLASMASKPPFQTKADFFSPNELLVQAQTEVCQQYYRVLSSHYPDNSYIQQSCLLASFFYSLTVDELMLSPFQAIHYLPNYSGDWTLGALLYWGATQALDKDFLIAAKA